MKKRHWGAVFIVAFIVTTIGIAYPLTAAGPNDTNAGRAGGLFL